MSSSRDVQWFELGFLVGSSFERVAFRSVTPGAHEVLGRAVNAARQRFCSLAPGQSHGLSLRPLSDLPSPATSASDLMSTLSDALGFMDYAEEEVIEKWEQLEALAQGIDEAVSGQASPSRVEVGFVWENGGGDDNPFDDGFVFSKASPAHVDAVHQFLQKLGEWGEEEGYWYDFTYDTSPSMDPTAGRMALNDFSQWVDENDSPMSQCLLPVVEVLREHEFALNLEESLPNPSRPRSPLRL